MSTNSQTLPTKRDSSDPIDVTECRFRALSASIVLLVVAALVLFFVLSIVGLIAAFSRLDATSFGAAAAVPWLIGLIKGLPIILAAWLLAGLFKIELGEAKVLQLFGRYVGTVRGQGLMWAPLLLSRRSVSIKLKTIETPVIKVNDLAGSPIEAAAVVVWRIQDTAKACFRTDSPETYVRTLTDAALRNLVSQHYYDSSPATGDEPASADNLPLRGHQAHFAQALRSEVGLAVERIGVEVSEARLSHLSYAPEVAGAMLQRQQARASIEARGEVAKGAVGLVKDVIQSLETGGVKITLSEAERSDLARNLIVVLCSNSHAQPVVHVKAAELRGS